MVYIPHRAGLPSGPKTVLGPSVPERPDVNAGKKIWGEYLRHVRKCEIVQHNLKAPDVQRKIDVALKRLDRGGRN